MPPRQPQHPVDFRCIEKLTETIKELVSIREL